MILLDAVTVSLPPGKPWAKTILNDITLSIAAGDRLAVVGENGTGKTTLLQTVAGLLPPDSGSVLFDRGGEPSGGSVMKPKFHRRRPPFAVILQEPDNQFVASSVRNELELGVYRAAGMDGNRNLRIRETIERFELGAILDRNPHCLSGGEKQRLAFATVWLADPSVLLLDEPTTYLDARSRGFCSDFVERLNSQGVTVVWATPGGEDLSHVERVVWLEKGGIRFDGSRGELLTRCAKDPDAVVPPPVFALSSRLFGEVENGDAGVQLTARRLLQMAGKELDGAENRMGETGSFRKLDGIRSTDSTGETILAFEDVSFAYDSLEAIQRVNIRFTAGQCVGLCGPNGSGKSTFLKLGSGVLKPLSGTVRGKYERVFDNRGQNMFLLFQSPERMFFAETVYEELAFGLKHLKKGKRLVEQTIQEALVEAGLEPDRVLGRSPMSLSFGEMRRLAFAIFLSLRPKLLFLDEPTACLDMTGRDVLRGILDRFLSGGGTVLIASHDVDFLIENCGRLIHLDEGRVVSDMDISSGSLPGSAVWPEKIKPAILQVQDALAALGVDVLPRAVRTDCLLECLAQSSQTRNPT